MSNFRNIVSHNRKTFYDYETGLDISQNRSNITKASLAILLTALFLKVDKDFVEAVVTIYAILVGFTFSILFYLLSFKAPTIDDSASLEAKARAKKLAKLAKELFYNISYFNMLAATLIFVCLIHYLFQCDSFDIAHHELPEIGKVMIVAEGIYAFVFYLLLVESGYSLFRTIGRVSFLFSEQLKNPAI